MFKKIKSNRSKATTETEAPSFQVSPQQRADRGAEYRHGAPYPEELFHAIKNLIGQCKKKSSETKCKALKALQQQCQNSSNPEVFKDLAPYWVSRFDNLVKYDNDNKVRLAAFQLQAVFYTHIVEAFGGPLTDDLFFLHWIGQSDPYKEVATAAKASYSKGFLGGSSKEQPALVQRHFERCVREATLILKDELDEEEATVKRLKESVLRAIAGSLRQAEVEQYVEVLRREPCVLDFLRNPAAPSVVTASLYCINSMTVKGVFSVEELAQATPSLFRLIRVNDRNLQTALWSCAIPDHMKQFPQFVEHLNLNELFNDLVNHLKKGGGGAGQHFYPGLVKLLPVFNTNVLQDKQKVRILLNTLLDGRTSEEGGVVGKFIINAFYEAVLYLYIKLDTIRDCLDEVLLRPVWVYLKLEARSAAMNYLKMVPTMLAQVLKFLEAKSQLPDLPSLLTPKLKPEVEKMNAKVTTFLEGLAPLNSGNTTQTQTMLRQVITEMYELATHALARSLATEQPEAAAEFAKRYVKFAAVASQWSDFEPDIKHLWDQATTEYKSTEILTCISELLQRFPKQWELAIAQHANNPGHVVILLPEGTKKELVTGVDCNKFSQMFDTVFQRFQNASTVPEVETSGEALGKSIRYVTPETVVGPIQQFLEECKHSQKPLALQQAQQLLEAAQGVYNEDISVYLAWYLSAQGWRSKVGFLWEVLKQLPAELHRVAVGKLIEEVKGKFEDPRQDYTKVLAIIEKLASVMADPNWLLDQLLMLEHFEKSSADVKSWKLIESLCIHQRLQAVDTLLSRTEVLAHLLEYSVAECLAEQTILQSKVSRYLETQVEPAIQQRFKQQETEFIDDLLFSLVKHAHQYPQTQLIMMRTLRRYLNDLTALGLSVNEHYHKASEYLEAHNGIDLVCEATDIYKHFTDTDFFLDTIARRRDAATQDPQPILVRLYASCLPDSAPVGNDLDLLRQCYARTFHPEDFTLALSLVRRGGLEALEELLEALEVRVIELLAHREAVHLVLPYVERLLGSPEAITYQEQLFEAITQLPIKHNEELSVAEALEVSETFTRLHTIASNDISEGQLYWLLGHCKWPSMLKALFQLLDYVYSNWECGQFPHEATETLAYVPEHLQDNINSQELGYIYTWLLLIRKYSASQRRQAGQSSTDFMDQLVKFLNENPQEVEVLLTVLMNFVHEDSRLPEDFHPATVDVTDEFSVMQLMTIVLFEFLSVFPSSARKWAYTVRRALLRATEKTVKRALATQLFAREWALIESNEFVWKAKGLALRGSKVAREISGEYRTDELVFRVVLKVPEAYPLDPVDISFDQSANLSHKTKVWTLRMRSRLEHENWRLLDLLLPIPDLVENILKGVEQCWICYCYVQANDKSLPNSQCAGCSNKFHKACILKWFNTSNKSNCPLCQNPFK